MPSVLMEPEAGIGEALVSDSVTAFRWSERVIIAFFTYAAGVAAMLSAGAPVSKSVILINLSVILTYSLLNHCDSGGRTAVVSYVRDWLALALILLAYREMGWLPLPHDGHALETRWVIWDRTVLRGGLTAAIEAFGAVLPSVLEIAYTLTYALAPFCVTVLYLYRRRDRVDRFLFIFALGVLLCYAQFPLWPSEPPRTVFLGLDLPAYLTVFRRFNLWMLGNYGIHTSCFPSGHVAAAFSAAFGIRQALPEHKWVSRVLLVMALLIAVATVYGRYHYVADAAAGFLVAVFAAAIGAVFPVTRRSPILRQVSIFR